MCTLFTPHLARQLSATIYRNAFRASLLRACAALNVVLLPSRSMARRVLLRLLPCLLCLVLLLLYAASVLRGASPPRHRQSLRTALVVEDRSGGLLAMHWNINTAAEPDRLAELGAVIRMHAPALVGLNEVALGRSAFARMAKAWGFAHSLLLKTDGPHRFNLGLMATTPLERHPSSMASPFFHGVLCARLPAWHGAHVCVTHLTPHSPAKRLNEAQALRRLLPAGPTLLLGDLNALSPRDAAAHRATGLRDRLAASASWEKFSVGMPPHGPTPKPEGDPRGGPPRCALRHSHACAPYRAAGDELDYAPLQALTAADALRDLHSGRLERRPPYPPPTQPESSPNPARALTRPQFQP